MHKYGPIVNVDKEKSPFGNTRRLVTDFDVKGNVRRAHSSVLPGGSAYQVDGKLVHEDVWKYLFTHPVDKTGKPTGLDPNCLKNQFQK